MPHIIVIPADTPVGRTVDAAIDGKPTYVTLVSTELLLTERNGLYRVITAIIESGRTNICAAKRRDTPQARLDQALKTTICAAKRRDTTQARLDQALKRLQEFQVPDEVIEPLGLLFGWLAKERERAKVRRRTRVEEVPPATSR